MKVIALLLALFAVVMPAYALTVETPLPDAMQELRAKNLFTEIRCVVCQSEAIADSPAEIARDMRRVVRAQVAEGKSDEAIKAYLVSQYGDAVLMAPPVNRQHILLWFWPALLLLFGASFIWHSLFRRNTP